MDSAFEHEDLSAVLSIPSINAREGAVAQWVILSPL